MNKPKKLFNDSLIKAEIHFKIFKMYIDWDFEKMASQTNKQVLRRNVTTQILAREEIAVEAKILSTGGYLGT